MKRFLLVEGVPGRLVAHPHVNPEARRFLGKLPNGPTWEEGPPGHDGKPRWAASKPVQEVVEQDRYGYLAKAGSKGDLKILNRCAAPDIEAARTQFAQMAKRTEK